MAPGLGLSVSYGIVEQHGGRLSVESEPGRTVFTLELPAAAVARARAGRRRRGAARARARGRGRRRAGGGRRAWAIVELVTTVLDAGRAGDVDVASGGRAALERLQQTHYDLVLSDVRMPEGDGADFYRAAVAQQRELAKRFLFMTGDTANRGRVARPAGHARPRAVEALHGAGAAPRGGARPQWERLTSARPART